MEEKIIKEKNIKGMGFKNKLIVGQDVEDWVANWLISMGWEITEKRNDNKYDLMAEKKGKKVKIEVKRDDKTNQTNNLFLEFAQLDYKGNYVNSGITSTLADYIMFVIPSQELMYIFEVKAIKEYIWGREMRVCNGGDEMRTKGFLFPLKKSHLDGVRHWIIKNENIKYL